jgi:hypothetical protein
MPPPFKPLQAPHASGGWPSLSPVTPQSQSPPQASPLFMPMRPPISVSPLGAAPQQGPIAIVPPSNTPIELPAFRSSCPPASAPANVCFSQASGANIQLLAILHFGLSCHLCLFQNFLQQGAKWGNTWQHKPWFTSCFVLQSWQSRFSEAS